LAAVLSQLETDLMQYITRPLISRAAAEDLRSI
jgi:hypothetical protein